VQDNEGWSGYTVDQVWGKMKLQYDLKPNIILINAGTNDCRNNLAPGDTPARMKAMIEEILFRVPGVTVILSGLVPHHNDAVNDCAIAMDRRYAEIVGQFPADAKVLFVPFVRLLSLHLSVTIL
jgi:lysophospholipase L1-like esterase